MSSELADTLQMTSRLRRHPTAARLRAALRGAGLEPDEIFLLTIDGGPDGSIGLLVDRPGRTLEFEQQGSRAVVRPVDLAADPLVAELLEKLPGWDDLQRAVADSCPDYNNPGASTP
ncbi:hypothetical protein DYH09_19720 [bacterium CPR1]|nr:hypothetical protein [bacterium CPR1]